MIEEKPGVLLRRATKTYERALGDAVAVGQEVERAKNTRSRNGADGVSADELRQLLAALEAARDGDFKVRLPVTGKGIGADIRRAFNELADRRESFSKEVVRVGRAIGREGRLTERAQAPDLNGHWVQTTNALNTLIDDLVRPTTEVARVIDAVANGEIGRATRR